jgi:acetoin utilization protein AcuB
MQREVVTIQPWTTLPQAIRLTRERGIRHLPVVHEGRLTGIVSDRDLKRAMASPATTLEVHELHYLLERVTVDQFMTPVVITIPPLSPVEDAAQIMVTEKISALPVVEHGRLVGIITETDLLRLFVRALGAGEPSSRIDVELGTDRSTLGDMVQTIGAAGVPISSIVTLSGPDDRWEVVIRVATTTPSAAIEALEARGYRVRDLEAPSG